VHFDVNLLPDGDVQISSHPFNDDDRIYSSLRYKRDSKAIICGMNIDEIAGLVAFVTSNDNGELISKTTRINRNPSYSGELPNWIRKPS